MLNKKAFTGSGAAVLMYTQDLQFYLAERVAKNRPFFGFLAGPGGSIEEGEVPVEAAAREVREETGLSLEVPRFELLLRTDNHITPKKEHGSGTPYSMWWYAVQLKDGEVPAVTEPTKQGVWILREWHGLKKLTPGAFEAIFKLLEPRANR